MLEIKDLVCGYDSFSLENINISVKKGEIIGIVGPNGSGKTTLLKAVSRALKVQNGQILLEGRDIRQMCFNELAQKMAVVSQGFEAGAITVEEFILLGRIPYFKKFQFIETKQDLKIARRAMELTDTLKLKDRFLSEISGGESQLVMIARALAQEPALLLLDEPTAHLDIAHQITVLDLIKRLNKELSLTVIMVLHDLNLASEYCRRLVMVSAGKVYKTGTPEDVLTCHVIEDVYKTVVVVKESPVSHNPYVFPVTEEERQKQRIQ